MIETSDVIIQDAHAACKQVLLQQRSPQQQSQSIQEQRTRHQVQLLGTVTFSCLMKVAHAQLSLRDQSVLLCGAQVAFRLLGD